MLDQMFLLNSILGTGILLLEIFLVSIILIFIFNKNLLKDLFEKNKKYLTEKNLLIVIFLFSLISSILTLVYSEYFGQVPCALCWFQRVFTYGIVVLSGTALSPFSTGEGLGMRLALKNIFVFSIFGSIFALYQHLEQILALYGTHLPCPVSGADCAKMTIFEYSHITFPWMAFVLFLFFIVAIFLQKKYK